METIIINNICHYRDVAYATDDINMVIYGINFNKKRQLSFVHNHNFIIAGSIHDTDSKNLEFSITNESPFYQPLVNFIGDQEAEIIKDDLMVNDRRIVLTKMDNAIKIEYICLDLKPSSNFQIMVMNDNDVSKNILITRLYILFHELSVVFKMYDRGFQLTHNLINSTF